MIELFSAFCGWQVCYRCVCARNDLWAFQSEVKTILHKGKRVSKYDPHKCHNKSFQTWLEKKQQVMTWSQDRFLHDLMCNEMKLKLLVEHSNTKIRRYYWMGLRFWVFFPTQERSSHFVHMAYLRLFYTHTPHFNTPIVLLWPLLHHNACCRRCGQAWSLVGHMTITAVVY